MAGIPERTYRRRLARLRAGNPDKGPWPAPVVDRIEATAAKYAQEWPAWGYRKIAALMRADGHEVTNSSVQRALRRRGLLLPQGFRADRKSWAALRRRVFHDPPTQRNRVWQTDFSEFETAHGGIWRISAVIDYVTKYCFAVTVTPTSRGRDAAHCIRLAVEEATRVLNLTDLRLDRGEMDVLDHEDNVIGRAPAPIAIVSDNGPCYRGKDFHTLFTGHDPLLRHIRTRIKSPKPTASSSGSSRHSNTSTCSAATSATATLSTWKPTASASSTTPSDPTKHSTTAHPKPPTSPTNPIKACQLLDSRHHTADIETDAVDQPSMCTGGSAKAKSHRVWVGPIESHCLTGVR
ncbi:hypothetical protein C6A82_007510 [Mycobacterium sp. ITM-2016-00318]|nr:hypothetical protein [Mycobacterium sp. ITM-2016-00318]WNG95732.1 hypothetical protein C6A82_007510 [Mycobacterium sp. ITM-2016-00318]